VILVSDSLVMLVMLVTGDPVAELDAALLQATARLRVARADGTCTAPELVAAVLTCGLGERPGWGKIPLCGTSSPVSDHGPGLRLAGAAGA
jgi:hypothetical protein